MDTATKKEFENLAGMIKRGFDATATKTELKNVQSDITEMKGDITEMKSNIKRLDGEVRHINATLGVMATDIADIKKHFVYRNEFEDLMARVKYLETKLGVESGK